MSSGIALQIFPSLLSTIAATRVAEVFSAATRSGIATFWNSSVFLLNVRLNFKQEIRRTLPDVSPTTVALALCEMQKCRIEKIHVSKALKRTAFLVSCPVNSHHKYCRATIPISLL